MSENSENVENKLSEKMDAFLSLDKCFGVTIKDSEDPEDSEDEATPKYLSAYDYADLAEYENGIILISDITKPSSTIVCLTACELNKMLIPIIRESDPRRYIKKIVSGHLVKLVTFLTTYLVNISKLYDLAFKFGSGNYNCYGLLPMMSHAIDYDDPTNIKTYCEIFPLPQSYYTENQKLGQFSEDNQKVTFMYDENVQETLVFDNIDQIRTRNVSILWHIDRYQRLHVSQEVYLLKESDNPEENIAVSKLVLDTFLKHNFNRFSLILQNPEQVGATEDSLQLYGFFDLAPIPESDYTYTQIDQRALSDCPLLSREEIKLEADRRMEQFQLEQELELEFRARLGNEQEDPNFIAAADHFENLQKTLLVPQEANIGEITVSARNTLDNMLATIVAHIYNRTDQFENFEYNFLVNSYHALFVKYIYYEYLLSTRLLRQDPEEARIHAIHELMIYEENLNGYMRVVSRQVRNCEDEAKRNDDLENCEDMDVVRGLLKEYYIINERERINRMRNEASNRLQRDFVAEIERTRDMDNDEEYLENAKSIFIQLYRPLRILNFVTNTKSLGETANFEDIDIEREFKSYYNSAMRQILLKNLHNPELGFNIQRNTVYAAALVNPDIYSELKREYIEKVRYITRNHRDIVDDVQRSFRYFETEIPNIRKYLVPVVIKGIYDVYFTGNIMDNYRTFMEEYKQTYQIIFDRYKSIRMEYIRESKKLEKLELKLNKNERKYNRMLEQFKGDEKNFTQEQEDLLEGCKKKIEYINDQILALVNPVETLKKKKDLLNIHVQYLEFIFDPYNAIKISKSGEIAVQGENHIVYDSDSSEEDEEEPFEEFKEEEEN